MDNYLLRMTEDILNIKKTFQIFLHYVMRLLGNEVSSKYSNMVKFDFPVYLFFFNYIILKQKRGRGIILFQKPTTVSL